MELLKAALTVLEEEESLASPVKTCDHLVAFEGYIMLPSCFALIFAVKSQLSFPGLPLSDSPVILLNVMIFRETTPEQGH